MRKKQIADTEIMIVEPFTSYRKQEEGYFKKLNLILPAKIDQIGDFLQAQLDKGNAPQSVSVLAFAIKRELKKKYSNQFDFKGSRLEWRIDNFFKTYIVKKREVIRRAPPPVPDILQFLKTPAIRTRTMARFLFVSGCRVQEMCSIRLIEMRRLLDRETNEWYYEILVHGKGSMTSKGPRDRIILMPDSLIATVTEIFGGRIYLFETRSGRPYNRKEVYAMFRDVSIKYVGYNINPHSLKHAFCDLMTREHHDKITDIARHVGTSVEILTRTYTRGQIKPRYLPLQEQASHKSQKSLANYIQSSGG